MPKNVLKLNFANIEECSVKGETKACGLQGQSPACASRMAASLELIQKNPGKITTYWREMSNNPENKERHRQLAKSS